MLAAWTTNLKRASVFQYLKESKLHIIFLQETHLDGSREKTLCKLWIERALHSTYSTFARGVSILISRAVCCTIHQVISDPGWGRYVPVVLDVYHSQLLLVNVYKPPPFQAQLLYDILTRLAQFLHLPVFLMGDFNAVLDAVLDSSNPNKGSSADLNSWASMAGLAETWRWKHPTDRCFAHISTSHRSSARIDLAFGNDRTLQYVSGIDYLAGGLSDHNPHSLALSFSAGTRKGGRRLLPSWLQNEQVAAQLGGNN